MARGARSNLDINPLDVIEVMEGVDILWCWVFPTRTANTQPRIRKDKTVSDQCYNQRQICQLSCRPCPASQNKNTGLKGMSAHAAATHHQLFLANGILMSDPPHRNLTGKGNWKSNPKWFYCRIKLVLGKTLNKKNAPLMKKEET